MPVKDMTGAVFGRLRVMSFVGVLADARAHWLCQCECGATHVTSGHSLDWRNNYLTVEVFAEHHGLTTGEACTLLDLARDVNRHEHPEA